MTVSELSFSRPVSQTASWLTGHSFCHLGSPGSRHAAVTHLSPGARGARPIGAFNQNRKRGSASHCSIRTDIIPAEWKLLTCRHHWSVVKCLAERFGLQVLFFHYWFGRQRKTYSSVHKWLHQPLKHSVKIYPWPLLRLRCYPWYRFKMTQQRLLSQVIYLSSETIDVWST